MKVPPAPVSAPVPTAVSFEGLCQQLMKTYAAFVKILEQSQAGLNLRSDSSKLGFPIFIMKARTWIANVSVSVRTISRPPELPAQIESSSPLGSFAERWYSNGCNISDKHREPPSWPGSTLRIFFGKILETPELLWTASGARWSATLSTS